MSMYNPIMVKRAILFLYEPKRPFLNPIKSIRTFILGLYELNKFLNQIEVLYEKTTLYTTSFSLMYTRKVFYMNQKSLYTYERRSPPCSQYHPGQTKPHPFTQTHPYLLSLPRPHLHFSVLPPPLPPFSVVPLLLCPCPRPNPSPNPIVSAHTLQDNEGENEARRDETRRD